MQLVHGDEVLTLKFDCKPCEMHVVGKIKPHILASLSPGAGNHAFAEELVKIVDPKQAR